MEIHLWAGLAKSYYKAKQYKNMKVSDWGWIGKKWTRTVADPGGPPLFLDQTEAWRAKKFFFETVPPLLT